MNAPLTEAELVERLAHVCHETWMRQKKRNEGVTPDPDDPTPTEHDYERARDILAELEALGVWPRPD